MFSYVCAFVWERIVLTNDGCKRGRRGEALVLLCVIGKVSPLDADLGCVALGWI